MLRRLVLKPASSLKEMRCFTGDLIRGNDRPLFHRPFSVRNPPSAGPCHSLDNTTHESPLSCPQLGRLMHSSFNLTGVLNCLGRLVTPRRASFTPWPGRSLV